MGTSASSSSAGSSGGATSAAGAGSGETGRMSPATQTGEESLSFAASLEPMLHLVQFVAFAHRNQRMKDAERTPYVNYLIEIACTLYYVGGVSDPKVLQAALLQNAVADTSTTLMDIQEFFGVDVQRIVAELTEDRALPKEQRRKLALLKIERSSTAAKLVKLGTLLRNLQSVIRSPRPDWSMERFRRFFSHAQEINERIRGTNIRMETAIDSLLRGKFVFHHQEVPIAPESTTLSPAGTDGRQATIREGMIFAAGISVVDISVEVPVDLVSKYHLTAGGDYVQSELSDSADLFAEIEKSSKKAIGNSGGSAYNTLRVAQWLLRLDKACALTGTASNDAYGESILRFANHSHIDYVSIVDGKGTTYTRLNLMANGTRTRVLRSDLGHLLTLSDNAHSEIAQRINCASAFFMTATFVHMQPEEALFIARGSLTGGKPLVMNVEGAILCDDRTRVVLEEVITYVYAFFGDENGYHVMSDKLGWKWHGADGMLAELAKLPRFTSTKQRVGFCLSNRNERLVLADNMVHSEDMGAISNTSREWLVDAAAGAFLSELAQSKNFVECLTTALFALGVVASRADMNLPDMELGAKKEEGVSALHVDRTKDRLTIGIMRKLPKAELHCHLDGSVRISTILELAKEQNVKLPTTDFAELKKLIVVGKECPSLVEYLRGFGITLLVMQKKYAITRCMYEVCEDAAMDGVRYIEVRFSPILHTDEGLSLSGVMDAVCEGAVMAENAFNIAARIIVCGMRQLPASVTEKLAEIAWRYQNRGVVGFDLAGPELGFSSRIHKSAFDIVRGHLLNCTLHSGEAAGWESVMDSIVQCGARRIGHGVRMRENSQLVDFVVDHRIPVESCVTSNLQTKAVSSLKEHPFREYFDRGVVIVPCTDNVTVSGVSLSSEYIVIQDSFDMKPAEILRLIDYGFRSAFLSISHKRRLRAECMHKALCILRDEGFDMHEPCLAAGSVGMSFREETATDMYSFENMRARASVYFFSNFKKGADWGKANPPLTLDLMRTLPKPDIHTRLDGSVSLETLWKMYGQVKDAESAVLGSFATMDDFRRVIQGHDHTDASDNSAKAIMNGLIQTEEQIKLACEDIITDAVDECVCYMELHVRPLAHLKKGLSPEQVLLTVLKAVKDAGDRKGLPVGVVVYVEPHTTPSRESVVDVVKLAIKYRDSGVCGFGFYGQDDTWTLSDKYTEAFDLLKGSALNVTVSAGRDKNVHSVVDALYKAGATRISGGFLVHKEPSLVNFLANYSIPVEMNLTENMLKGTADVSTFAGNVIRLYLDNQLRVTVCSFDKTLYPNSRSQSLLKVAEMCNLEIHELLDIFATGIRKSFQSRSKRREIFQKFWTSSVEILEKAGFQHFRERHYFPENKKTKRVKGLSRSRSFIDDGTKVLNPLG